jgi:leucyl/phenylalanyl-tRNA--protein transferase
VFHHVGVAHRFDPETVLTAYGRGIFPMGDDDGTVHWLVSDPRFLLPIGELHVPRSLARFARNHPFDIRVDTAFRRVMEGCAADRGNESLNWITPRMIEVYEQLHHGGFAHSVEAWRGGVLVGGLYGVALGGAFFGESMFTRIDLGGTNASKLCLLHLDGLLARLGFVLLDSQEKNEHMDQFGGELISFEQYQRRLIEALTLDPAWVV